MKTCVLRWSPGRSENIDTDYRAGAMVSRARVQPEPKGDDAAANRSDASDDAGYTAPPRKAAPTVPRRVVMVDVYVKGRA
jgi:hypothetical protein